MTHRLCVCTTQQDVGSPTLAGACLRFFLCLVMFGVFFACVCRLETNEKTAGLKKMSAKSFLPFLADDFHVRLRPEFLGKAYDADEGTEAISQQQLLRCF